MSAQDTCLRLPSGCPGQGSSYSLPGDSASSPGYPESDDIPEGCARDENPDSSSDSLFRLEFAFTRLLNIPRLRLSTTVIPYEIGQMFVSEAERARTSLPIQDTLPISACHARLHPLTTYFRPRTIRLR
jgi:hypothetical protein